MIPAGERVFVDTGAWIALAVQRDPLHERARETWEDLRRAGARLFSSVAVVLETFTYLDRKGSRDLALAWRRSLETVDRLEILPCTPTDIDEAMAYFDRKQFHKLGLVDATSFVLMKHRKIRVAFAFDVHFSIAGFRHAS